MGLGAMAPSQRLTVHQLEDLKKMKNEIIILFQYTLIKIIYIKKRCILISTSKGESWESIFPF